MGYKHIPASVIDSVHKMLSAELVTLMYNAAVMNQKRLKQFADDCDRANELLEKLADCNIEEFEQEECEQLCQKWGIPL